MCAAGLHACLCKRMPVAEAPGAGPTLSKDSPCTVGALCRQPASCWVVVVGCSGPSWVAMGSVDYLGPPSGVIMGHRTIRGQHGHRGWNQVCFSQLFAHSHAGCLFLMFIILGWRWLCAAAVRHICRMSAVQPAHMAFHRPAAGGGEFSQPPHTTWRQSCAEGKSI